MSPDARVGFAQQLSRVAGDITRTELLAHAPEVVRADTLDALLDGTFTDLPPWRVIESVLLACSQHHQTPLDLPWWRDAYDQLMQQLTQAGATSPSTSVSNTVTTAAATTIVQAGAIYGGVHVATGQHSAPTWLHEYLEALARADDTHEYRTILDDGPPLSAIYLQRTAVQHGTADGDRVPAEKLLDSHDGVQITGEPGAGKSSLLRRLAAVTARDVLAGRSPAFVPVLITARDLARVASLREALVAGTLGKTEQILDRGQLGELFRDSPMPGVPWLVLVDGFDEVIDIDGQRNVLEKVKSRRNHPSYRFVVASRPIRSDGFRTMGEDRYPTYMILPFTDDEWITFAARWIHAHGHQDAHAMASDLLARVDQTKLGVLTRIPLTASMICLLHLDSPNQALPENQSQLYSAFVGLLLSKLPKVDVRAQLDQALSRYDSRAAAACHRLVDNIRDLMEYLAGLTQVQGPVTTMTDLTTRALSFPAAAIPPGVTERDWREVLAKVIGATGLLTAQANGEVRYLHPTIAEYLAARHLFGRTRLRGVLGACRVFAPQRTWPWPDLNVKVFLAANWLEEGYDLRLALRRLLLPRHRQHNAGFIVELLRHGIPVDQGLIADTVAATSAIILSVTSEPIPWQNAVSWLRQLNVEVLDDSVTTLLDAPTPRGSRPRRSIEVSRVFEAISCLFTLDWPRAAGHAQDFFLNPEVSVQAMTALARQVARTSPETSFEMLRAARAQTEDEPHGLKLVEAMLAVHPERAGSLVATALRTSQPTTHGWRERLLLLDQHAPEQAVDGWVSLLRVVTDPQLRGMALTRVATYAPERALAAAQEITRDTRQSDESRFQAARFAAGHLDDGGSLLRELDMQQDRPAAKAKAAAQWGIHSGQRDEAIRIIRRIRDECPSDSPARFEIAEAMRILDKDAAIAMLRDEILNDQHLFHTRFGNLDRLHRWAPQHEVARVCERLALAPRTRPIDAMLTAEFALTVCADKAVLDALIVTVHERDEASGKHTLTTYTRAELIGPETQIALAWTLVRYDPLQAQQFAITLSSHESATVRREAKAFLKAWRDHPPSLG